jgi:endonuclease-3 related protein
MHFPAAKKPAQHQDRAGAPAGKPSSTPTRRAIARFYRILLRQWGPQNWWPAASKFEVMVGAILTQNTSWTNVEKALGNLREAGMLSIEALHQADGAQLESLLRPAGYFRQKTRRLQDLTAFILANYGAGRTSVHGGEHPAMARLFDQTTEKLRSLLLKQKGVGPETADSILLYGGNHAVFVVDAYTRRIFERHQLVIPGTDYETIRLLVERSLRSGPPEARGIIPDDIVQGDIQDNIQGDPAATADRPGTHDPSAISTTYRPALVQRYNEFHALLVQVGKHYCLKKAPKCTNCPLSCLLPASDNA